jgi:hypothetical protein
MWFYIDYAAAIGARLHLRSLTQVLAFFGAAGFFAYKAITGYLFVNMSLAGALEREHVDEASDDLAVAATLRKGDSGTLELHDARARVSWEGGNSEAELVGIARLGFDEEHTPTFRRRVRFDRTSGTLPLLNLTPSEAATFSAVFRVPRSKTCTVEIAVVGQLKNGRKREHQWRTSLVSLPLPVAQLQENREGRNVP